jgi:G3E family GTPase
MSQGLTARIPVFLLTGFLGSGKTTLLAALLGQPAFAQTAVLINEVGEVGLDQRLVGAMAMAAPTLLAGGCVCCTVRGDLAAALEDLYWQRLERRIPRFERVIIETTGLAHPLPLIETLDAEGIVAERYRLAAVLSTADAVQGAAQLERHPECHAQASLADRLIITRTDQAAPEAVENLHERLRAINPVATIIERSASMPVPEGLLDDAVGRVASALSAGLSAPASRVSGRPISPVSPGRAFAHAAIDSFTLRPDGVWPVEVLEQTLRRLIERLGDGLLRLKGIVATDRGDQVVQVATGLLHPLLPAPEGRGERALVVIVEGVSRSRVIGLLAQTLPIQASQRS